MKKSLLILVLTIQFVFFNSFIKNEITAQTASVTLVYGAYTNQCCSGNTTPYTCYGCTSCTGCYSTAFSVTKTFTDPIPAGNVITNVTVNYYTIGGSGKTLGGNINGELINNTTDGNTGTSCSSAAWGVSSASSTSYPCGFPVSGANAYNYGGTNSFVLNFGGQICINKATLIFTYGPKTTYGPPVTPNTPSGSTSVCAGTAYTYSIPPTANTTGYTWTVPSGWTINSGQGTTSINVTAGSTAGNICVNGTNACGAGLQSCLAVSILPSSTAPTSASANPTTMCSGTSTLTVSGGSLGTGATWNWYSGSCNGTSVGTGSSITVSPSSTTTYYVNAVGTCNTTACASTQVTIGGTTPAPGLPTGSTSPCGGTTQTYNTTGTAGATSYNWTVPAGSVINSGQGTTSISVTLGSTSGNVCVTATGVCGISAASCTPITITNAPSAPGTISGPTPVCLGNDNYSIAAVAGATGYAWNTNGGGAVTAGGTTTNATVTWTTSGTYVVSVTASNGCGTSSQNTFNVTVNPRPTITINSTSTSVCSGSSTTFTASGANTYTWANAATLSSSTGSVVTATPVVSPTVYTVTGTDVNNCVNTNTISITVNPTPTVTISGGGGNSQTVCGGGLVNNNVNAINFNVTPAGTVTWTNSNTGIGLGASGTGNIATYTAPAVSSQTIGVITATATSSGSSCPSTSSTQLTYTVTINPIPGATTPTITPASCNASDGTITGSTGTGGTGAYSYSWDNGVTFSPSSSYTNAAGTYTLEIKDNGTGCISQQNYMISNVGAPSPPAVTPSSSVACQGGTVTFAVNSPVAGTTYSWTEANGTTGTGTTYTVTNIPSMPSPYTVSVTATASGCTGVAGTTSITINPTPTLPVLTAPTGANNSYCQGSPSPLTVSSGTTTPAATAVWYSGGTMVYVGNSYTPPASLPAGTYTFSVIDSIPMVNGCVNAPASANTLTLSLTVNPLPSIPVLTSPTGTNNSYCQGSPSPLTVNTGTNTAVWYSNNTVVNTGSVFNPPASLPAGTYTFSVIDSIPAVNGCVNAPQSANTLTLTLVVNPIPNPPSLSGSTGANNSYCQGSPSPLTVSSGTTTPAATAVWYSGGTMVYVGNSYTPPASLPAGTYTFSVIDSIPMVNGCVNAPASANTLTLSLTVNPLPSIPVLTSPTGTNNSYCQGSPSPLTVNTGTNTAVWYSNNTVVNTGSVFNPPASLPAGTYTFSVIDSIPAVNGCVNAPQSANTLTLTLVVNPIPNPPSLSGSTGANNSYCQGSPSPLTVSSGTTTPAATAVWYSGGTMVYVGNSYTPPASLPAGTYTFSVIDSIPMVNGCVNAPASANTFTLSLTVNPTPTLNVSSGITTNSATCGQPTGGVSVPTGNVTGGTAPYSYQWYNGNSPISGQTNSTLSGVVGGTYSLQVMDANNCIANITGGPGTFSVPTSVQPTASFSTTPSPAIGSIPLSVVFTNTSNNASTYVWYFGDTVLTSNATSPTHIYNSVGTYTVILVASNNGNCPDTARATIIAEVATTIIIPNVFTPNGDGLNDQFFINNTGMNSLNCQIFNRWGQQMFTITAPNQAWDGKAPNGDKAPDGTYMYILQAQGLDGKTYKQQGTLTLVR